MKKIISISFVLILTILFLVSAQENILWGETSTTINLPNEEIDNLPVINDSLIDWETGGIIVGIIILLIIGYKIKSKKKVKKIKKEKRKTISKKKNTRKLKK